MRRWFSGLSLRGQYASKIRAARRTRDRHPAHSSERAYFEFYVRALRESARVRCTPHGAMPPAPTMSSFWQRVEVKPDHVVGYRILPFRMGLVLKVSTDGTPWTLNGKRYLVSFIGDRWRVTLGRYVLAIRWRLP